MRVLGNGDQLWRVETVLWVAETSHQREIQMLSAVADAMLDDHRDADVPRVKDVDHAWSYDMQPPEPARGAGVACWVRADSVGDAANTVWAVVESAAARIFQEAPRLWDLRVIPRAAILSASDTGTPLSK